MAIALDRTFEVDADPETTWSFLTDPDRVFPCIPSAKVVRKLDDRTFEGEIGFSLGPFGATFRGKIEYEEIEPDDHRIRMSGDAEDVRRDARASMVMTSRLSPASEGGTRVELSQTVELSGSLAGMADGALAENMADMLFGRFVRCVQSSLGGG